MEKQEDKIKEMLELQDELNIKTSGDDWKSGIAKNGKTIDWALCIVMETAEFIDSFPWKHWKDVDKEPDFENARMELIDIWHFILSYTMEQGEENVLINYGLYNVGLNNDSIDTQIIINRGFELINAVTSDHYKSHHCRIYSILNTFNSLLAGLHFRFSELYQLYMAKNWLNGFRQLNGYQAGTYKKMLRVENIDGTLETKEDNAILMALVDELSLTRAYIEFQKIYTRNVEEIK